jgi:hypothetical protein
MRRLPAIRMLDSLLVLGRSTTSRWARSPTARRFHHTSDRAGVDEHGTPGRSRSTFAGEADRGVRCSPGSARAGARTVSPALPPSSLCARLSRRERTLSSNVRGDGSGKVTATSTRETSASRQESNLRQHRFAHAFAVATVRAISPSSRWISTTEVSAALALPRRRYASAPATWSSSACLAKSYRAIVGPRSHRSQRSTGARPARTRAEASEALRFPSAPPRLPPVRFSPAASCERQAPPPAVSRHPSRRSSCAATPGARSLPASLPRSVQAPATARASTHPT